MFETVEVWEMGAIEVPLVQAGVPVDVAHDFAYWVVFVIGI
ncbi:hypothetical protein QVA66_02925 [Staphylococcus chromogenes]|nr:hypothetical protein [Staphylococcus chromogenes]